MGLDWIVKTYKKNTFVDAEELGKDIDYEGLKYVRGKAIVGLLEMYDLAPEHGEECYGEFKVDENGNERGPFIDLSTLNIINECLLNCKLVEHKDWSVEEQEETIGELGCLINDLEEYECGGDYDLKVWCWY